MLTKKPQAIAGVSPGSESIIEELYPSITATWLGQLLNGLYESIPIGMGNIKLSHAFALVTWPFALVGYLLMKVGGSRYVVTNRSVKRRVSIGDRLLEETPLAGIDRVTVDPDSRLAFFKTGDVRLSSAAGDTLLLLRGVPYPDRFCQVILEARDAQQQVAASLATMNARK
ncbi:MAG: hypothetical protein SH850_30735 [Planctomycetaceae bacterium]|nr:hypothetical protein [Planctomycetaceae bacterium]